MPIAKRQPLSEGVVLFSIAMQEHVDYSNDDPAEVIEKMMLTQYPQQEVFRVMRRLVTKRQLKKVSSRVEGTFVANTMLTKKGTVTDSIASRKVVSHIAPYRIREPYLALCSIAYIQFVLSWYLDRPSTVKN